MLHMIEEKEKEEWIVVEHDDSCKEAFYESQSSGGINFDHPQNMELKR